MEIRYHLEEIESVAQQVVKALTSKIILFNGNMGVGKTTFIKSFVKTLGSKDDVSSPTFSIVNDYDLENDKIFHFDMYRIKDEDEALQIGIEDYFSTEHWILIEWSENIINLLPTNVHVIELILNNDHSRTLKLTENINLTNKYGTKLHKL